MTKEHVKNVLETGVPLQQANSVLIMLHGRGASPEDIISLVPHLKLNNTHIIAPHATNSTWYPNSFLAPVELNEPWLSSALSLLKSIVEEIKLSGIIGEHIYLLGFSQGACLTLEFAARNAQRFGGVIAFTGGLIGEIINEDYYKGNFANTKVFIGNSDRDPHVPVVRSQESKRIMEKRGAAVTLKIYPGMTHTINEDEINWVNQNIFYS